MKNKEHPILTQIKISLDNLYPFEEIKSMSKIICEDLLGINYLSLLLDKDIIISEKQKQDLTSILERLISFEPIQYIVGKTQFLGYTFDITPGALIPRPETEQLVAMIINEQKGKDRILDIGTGSGCIAISLALELPKAYVEAWEKYDEALALARKNKVRLKSNVVLKKKDLFQEVLPSSSFDVIVSNPPYITEKERVGMEPNVLEWEPNKALFVPDDNPLIFYERIAKIGLELLNPSGVLYFEINWLFGEELVAMLKSLGYKKVELKKDFYQCDRFIKALR